MPIEIRELIIRATVSEGGEKPRSKSKDKGSSKEELIEFAVREMSEILKTKKQR